MPPAPRPPRTRTPEPRPGYVAVGWVRAPHSIHGELRVARLSDNPNRFDPGSVVWAGGERYTVEGARGHRGALLIQLEGVTTRSQADAFRNLLLEVPEEDLAPLAEGEYYRFQLLGMDVYDGEGNGLGRIEQVLDTGANDVYIVMSEEGELLIPAIDTVVKEIDVPGRRMLVELLEGLERRPPQRPRSR